MRILIYGAGAVGNYLGATLALGGHQVTLLGRERFATAIARDGLTLTRDTGEQQKIPNIQGAASLDQALSGEPYDWIAFTMKAYDTLESIYELQSKLSSLPPIVSFQNGLGSEESLRSAFGDDQVVAGTLTTAVSMNGDNMVVEERNRGAAIAGDSLAAPLIERAFRDTSIRFEVIPSTDALKWSKLLTNMLANATCAILDMPPAEAMKLPEIFRIEVAALKEALAMMELQDIEAVDLPGTPVKMLVWGVRWLPQWLLHPLLYRQLAKGRGDKLPSLHLTLRSGRKETEAAWLNGGIAQAASAQKRLTPINHALALLLTDIAVGRVPWDMYRYRPEMLVRAIRVAEGMPR